jgi:O-antigen biosynthesis protein
VILEAMAYKLPIITTPVFGITEQVQEAVECLALRARRPSEARRTHEHPAR